MAEVSTKPYLVRAIYEWCADSGYRPFLAVAVDARTQVPREFVRNGEIVLNISAEATDRLHIGNDLLEFVARFGGVARQVSIPIENISAIFAQETGHGMAFEVPARVPDGGQAHEEDAAGAPAHEVDADSAKVKRAPSRNPRLAAVESGEDDAPDAPKGENRGASEEGEAAPAGKRAADGQAADKRRAPAKRTAPAKRARRTVLRDVSARPAGSGEAVASAVGADAASAGQGGEPDAATPKAGKAPAKDEADRDAESAERPDGDDPAPSTPKRGKPRLTRVK